MQKLKGRIFFCGNDTKLNVGYISDLWILKESIFNSTDIKDHLIHHIFGQVICGLFLKLYWLYLTYENDSWELCDDVLTT